MTIALGSQFVFACSIKTSSTPPSALLGTDHAKDIVQAVNEELKLEPRKFTIIISTTHTLPTPNLFGRITVNKGILAVSIIWINSDGTFCDQALYCLSTDDWLSAANATVSLTHKWIYQKKLH